MVKKKTCIIDAPKEIWLVVGDIALDEVKFDELAEVMWAEYEVFDNDIRYIRADLVEVNRHNKYRSRKNLV